MSHPGLTEWADLFAGMPIDASPRIIAQVVAYTQITRVQTITKPLGTSTLICPGMGLLG